MSNTNMPGAQLFNAQLSVRNYWDTKKKFFLFSIPNIKHFIKTKKL